MAIVTNGLRLHLDAGNVSSYPGTGQLWYDLSPSGLTGSMSGTVGPVYSSDNSGQFIFDGNDYFRIPATASLRPTNVTIEAFAYLSDWNITNDMKIVSNVGTSTGYQLALNDSTNSKSNLLTFEVRNSSTTIITEVSRSLITPGWHHVVGTYDGTYLRLYIDTQLQQEKLTLSSSINWAQSPDFIIGAQASTITDYWSGSIANVKVYNRALTESEIQQNFDEMSSRYSLTEPTSSMIRNTRISAQTLTSRLQEPSSSINITKVSLQSLSPRLQEPSSSINITRTSFQLLVSGISYPPPPPPTPPTELPAVSGSLWGWGAPVFGLTGIVTASLPLQIDTSNNWKDVAELANSWGGTPNGGGVALKTDGTMWHWGWSDSTMLVTGNNIVKVNNDTDWKKIFTGPRTAFAIKNDGSLWAWGWNVYGQLGLGYTGSGVTSYVPTPILVDAGPWYSISGGIYHTLGIKSDGTMWGWGTNSGYELGLGSSTPGIYTTPTLINSTHGWKYVLALTQTSIAVREDGKLFSWGNGQEELGLGLSSYTQVTQPTQIGTDSDWDSLQRKFILFNNDCVFAKKTNGTLWSWGRGNYYGDLGTGNTTAYNSPTQIGTDTDWKNLHYGLGLKEDNTLYLWGNNEYGQLGQNDIVNRSSPTQIGTDTDWLKVTQKEEYVLGIRTATPPPPPPPPTAPTPSPTISGSLWVWGDNSYQQLGIDNGYEDIATPTQIGEDYTWKHISIGSWEGHAMGVKTDGTLWGWGQNYYGQLGLGYTGSDVLVPTQVGSGTDWDKVFAGGEFSIGIKSDGTLWGWGNNEYAQLGQGYTGSYGGFGWYNATPVLIDSDNWYTVSAGDFSTMAIKSDGTLWGWGYNDGGDNILGLATGSLKDILIPTQVGTDYWKSIYHNYGAQAVRADGTLWAWGGLAYGLLPYTGSAGQIENVSPTYPNQIGTDADWDEVTGLYYKDIVYLSKTDGTLWAVGLNYAGQAGLGYTSSYAQFVQIGSGSEWKSVNYGPGIQSDSSLWRWGDNENGEMGIGVSGSEIYPLTKIET